MFVFLKAGEGAKCVACPAEKYLSGGGCHQCSANSLAMTALALALGVLSVSALWWLSKNRPAALAVLSIFFSSTQILIFFLEIDLHWPPAISAFFRAIKSIVLLDMFALSRPECLSTTDLPDATRAAIKLLVPFACILLAWAVSHGAATCKKASGAKYQQGYLHLKSLVLITAYPMVSWCKNVICDVF
jgi:hypothetical protein